MSTTPMADCSPAPAKSSPRSICRWPRLVWRTVCASATTNEVSADPPESITVGSLRIGSKLEEDVFDENGVLLLRAGSEITERFVERLKSRGICELHSRRGGKGADGSGREQQELQARADQAATAATRLLDEDIEQSRFDTDLPQQRNDRASGSYLKLAQLREELEQTRRFYDDSINAYAELATEVINGNRAAVNQSVSMLGQLMHMLGRDPRLGLLALNMKVQPDDYLFQHGINVAILTMYMALYLGFPEEEVVHAGLGAMYHDLGMLKVPQSTRLAPRKLSQSERFEIEVHPIHTVNMLERLGNIPETALLVAYQIHERYDGRGYPRGRSYLFTHPLSRVASVTDSYVAWSSWRPHRPARTPYHAMGQILSGASSGMFDRAVVRAFLDCMSLFPVGSRVLLSNDTPARVMRSNMGMHTRPIVQLLNADGSETDEQVDLNADSSLRIVAEWDDLPGKASA